MVRIVTVVGNTTDNLVSPIMVYDTLASILCTDCTDFLSQEQILQF